MNLGQLKFSSCAFPQGRFSRTEGTATAQASPPVGVDSRMSFQSRSANRRTQLWGRLGHLGHSRPRFPDLPPFSGGSCFNAYGSETLLPYVGAVKGLALPIVYQAINRGGDRHFHSSSQFSVLSSQFSVLSFQFSVLSSQFSVLSSQFSVLSSQFSDKGSWVVIWSASSFSKTEL